ncbi:hypothetical protein [Leuconostoc citreum]|uniref:hypothetical protein n=1 Tax=Leuconostoc citreum TaxID=33964 RepID=UPI0006618808|nr:hypothetical protein [Leuconostoc citreum]MBA5937427.1 hypothetical protein [Leuconostoc citreum]MBE4726280.1 hypothetical protein [Leuconostoc citreum]MCT3069474.1 hypothetical protein [Leuconostoc citreum]QEA37177.1 hypothetical protein FGL87_07600 [Leuconostoc citreum]GEK60665.1 hypothetical protein LCI01_03010 [Leuconostoc citreum]
MSNKSRYKRPKYFEKTVNYVFSTIGDTVKERKKILKLRRQDILDDDNARLVSIITRGKSTDQFPNLMTDATAFDLVEALNFKNTDQLLWSNIDWNILLATALDELYFYRGTADADESDDENRLKIKNKKMLPIQKSLFNALSYNVSFASMNAALTFDHPSDAEHDAIKGEAIRVFLSRAESLYGEQLSLKLKNKFDKRIAAKRETGTSGISKFSVEFPEIMFDFFDEVFHDLKPLQNSTGMLAYYLTINACEASESAGLAMYSNDNVQSQKYDELVPELVTAISAMQKVQSYEDSIIPPKIPNAFE